MYYKSIKIFVDYEFILSVNAKLFILHYNSSSIKIYIFRIIFSLELYENSSL